MLWEQHFVPTYPPIYDKVAHSNITKARIPFDEDFAAKFQAETPAKWKMLDGTLQCTMSRRMIGGCLDTLVNLVGTPYGELPQFIRDYSNDGVVFYLENCELTPVQVTRALWQIRTAGWFDGISGLILGRSDARDSQ